MYKVSFLIPVYNAAAFISNCLEHIVQSELESSEYQIIAWDDGSKDNSFDILQNYAIILKGKKANAIFPFFFIRNLVSWSN